MLTKWHANLKGAPTLERKLALWISASTSDMDATAGNRLSPDELREGNNVRLAEPGVGSEYIHGSNFLDKTGILECCFKIDVGT